MTQAPKPSAERTSFVCDIVSDPKAVPDAMLLYGYLGASSEEGHERLYLSPHLTSYVEVPTTAILHQMAAPQAQDPHGGVTLWEKKDATLIYKRAPAAEALAGENADIARRTSNGRANRREHDGKLTDQTADERPSMVRAYRR